MPGQFTEPIKISKTFENWKGRKKKSLTFFFLADIMMYVENTEESTHKLLPRRN